VVVNKVPIRIEQITWLLPLFKVLADNLPPQHSTSSTNRIGKTDTQFVEDLCAAFTLYDEEYEKHQSKPRMMRFVWRERNKDFMIRGKELRHRTYT
jgi:hypothetical protein